MQGFLQPRSVSRGLTIAQDTAALSALLVKLPCSLGKIALAVTAAGTAGAGAGDCEAAREEGLDTLRVPKL